MKSSALRTGLVAAVTGSAVVLVGAWAFLRPGRSPSTPPAVVPEAALAPAQEPNPDFERIALAAHQNPRNAELAVEAGGLAGDHGQYADALRWFQRAERLNPSLVPAITGQGQMWMELGRPGPALTAYERASKLAPNEPRLLLEVARAYTFMREFQPALAYVARAEKLGGLNPEVCRAYALIYAGNYENARSLEWAKRATELGAGDPENWATWGTLLLTNRQYAEAEKPFRKAVELNAAHIGANLGYARALIEGRKSTAADAKGFPYLARVRTLDPGNAEALHLQGQLLVRAGELKPGISLLRMAREADPRNSAILLALGQALVRAGQGEEGVGLIRAGQKLGPRGVSYLDLEDLARKNPDPAIVDRLADLYRRQELYDSAVRVLERALRRHPGNAQLQQKLRLIRTDLQRRDPLAAAPPTTPPSP